MGNTQEIDPKFIKNILTLRYNPQPHKLLPDLDSDDFTPNKIENLNANLETRIKNGIIHFVENEKPNRIALALSGGVDSILALVFFRELFPEMKISCMSFGFSDNDIDVEQAKEIARQNNADFESVHLENFYNNLPKQISIIKEPKINYYWYFVAEKAKKYSNFIITGDGGDELFGGYVFRYKKYLELVNAQSSWKDKVIAYLNCHNRDWVDDQDKMFGQKASFSWDEIYELLRKYFDNSLGLLDQVFLADYHGKLMNDWITSYSRIYSHFDIKGFSPFLDSEVIKFVSHIPSSKKYNIEKNIGKIPLREIIDKKGFYVDSNKRGFSPDWFKFWNSYGKQIVSQYLSSDANVVRNDWINYKWIQSSLIKANNQDIRYINKLLHVTSFEIWYRLFITHELYEDDTLI
jgi:asparagine synthase (glutamine-hydrolysing)